jgi:aminopeptidase-like protein
MLYFELLKSLAPLDRCHLGPEMENAYQQLVKYYPGSRLLKYNSKEEVHKWSLPPHWACTRGELIDDNGKVIASRKNHKLELFTYSPPINKTVSLNELQEHLFSDPNRPDAICFHFRNQYRHWEPVWGFSIPHRIREKLTSDTQYHVRIESQISYDQPMIQSDYHHQGELDQTYLFVGHFDHPEQVNDGLAGCIAAYEIIKRLQNKKTRYSYRALSSVEIVGSVYYLDDPHSGVENVMESLFLGFSGIDSSFIYQQSVKKNSMIDRIVIFFLSFYGAQDKVVFNHRELIGNDENVFDSVGYEIPSGTLMRWPFPQYHTDSDNIDITSEDKLEEVIDFGLRIVDVIENNYYLLATYSGIPSLANPDIDLYLSLDFISNIRNASNNDMERFQCDLPEHELKYMENNTQILNQFMQNIVRLSDGKHTILDIAESSKVPFGFVHMYASLMEEKGLVSFSETMYEK